MSLFSQKSNVEIENLKQRLNTLEGKLEILNTSIKNLRGIVNRKIGNEPDDKEEGLNNTVLLADHGQPFR